MNYNIGTIPPSYQKILKDLEVAEGGILHYNEGEEDITNGFGIYRNMHPHARVFEYIDSVAMSIGVTSPSRTWTKNSPELKQVRNALQAQDPSIERWLSYEFYQKYFGNLQLESLPMDIASVLVSLYTNGQKLCGFALQTAINDMYRKYKIGRPVPVDCMIGPGTMGATIDLCRSCPNDQALENFKYLILLAAKTYYISTVVNSPGAFLKFLKGWNSRVDSLI